MGKRLFEILDEMNQHDTAHGTKLVQVSGTFLKSDLRSKGTEIITDLEEANKEITRLNQIIKDLNEVIRVRDLMIQNGLGWEDMKNDIKYPSGD